jgi:PAS domain S-box-containing protein
MTTPAASRSERVLILAPLGRDSQIAAAILGEAGLSVSVCRDLAELRAELDREAGAALVVEEALQGPHFSDLVGWIDAQPAWSDFPIVILAGRGGGLERNPEARRFSETLGAVSFLERPFHPTTLVSIMQTALRGRRRQYEARARIEVIRAADERLRLSEASLRLATDAAEVGTWDLDLETNTLTWSDRTKAMFGISPDRPCTMDDFYAGLHPEDAAATSEAFAAALDPERRSSYDVEYRTIGREDGVVRWVAAKGKGLFDDLGRCVRAIGTALDVTQRKAIEERLRNSEASLRLALDAGRLGAWELDLPDHILRASLTCKANFGREPDERFTYEDLLASVHPEDRPRMLSEMRQAIDSDRDYDLEHRVVRPDGRISWVLVRAQTTYAPDGAPERMTGVSLDITERKYAEEHLRLMVNELNHRVKNSLATVQAIAAQTLRREEIPAHIRESLTSRLLALARAHDVLTDEKWSGASLREIAHQTAAPYEHAENDRFSISGPPQTLPPKTAIAVALAFHELATNAAKYGALSVPDGRVSIEWSVAPHARDVTLRLVWRETGGPPVSPPERTGFGTRLIERGLSADLGGAVKVTYPATGVVCTIEAVLPANRADEEPGRLSVRPEPRRWEVRAGDASSVN